MYFATRSDRAGAPVLIWPQLVATARSAIVVSSVSPERWLIMQRKPARCARSTASRVSVSEPIWLTLTSSALAWPPGDAALEPLDVGDEEVVADELDLGAERSVMAFQPSQSSSLSGSSMLTIGYAATSSA